MVVSGLEGGCERGPHREKLIAAPHQVGEDGKPVVYKKAKLGDSNKMYFLDGPLLCGRPSVPSFSAGRALQRSRLAHSILQRRTLCPALRPAAQDVGGAGEGG